MWVLVRRRLLLSLGSGQFWAVCCVILALSEASLLAALPAFRIRLQVQGSTLRQLEDKLRDPSSRVYSQLFALASRSHSPLSVFFQGAAELGPDIAVIHGRFGTTEFVSSETENLWTPASLRLDPIRLLPLLLTLLAIIYGTEVAAGEREMGTLQMLFSFTVSRGEVLAAEVAAGCIILAVPIAITGLAAAATLQLEMPGVLRGALLAQMLSVYGGLLLLGTGFLFLGLALSASGLGRESAAGVGFALWVVLGLLAVPQGSGVPLEASNQRGQTTELLSEGIFARANPMTQRILATSGDEGVLHKGDTNYVLLALVPFSAYFDYVGVVTGTGIESWYYYLEQIGATRIEFDGFIGGALSRHPGQDFKWTANSPPVETEGIPVRTVHGSPWASRVGPLVAAVLGLLVFNGVGFVVAAASFLSMDVRMK